jgi:hypothetical protein
MPVRVLDKLGEGDAETIGKGIRFAARNGAQVINLSLVFPTSPRTRRTSRPSSRLCATRCA